MGGGPSYYYPSSTGQEKAGPWKAQAPYLKGQYDFGQATRFGVPEEAGIFKRAQDIANTPLPYYGMEQTLNQMPEGWKLAQGQAPTGDDPEKLYTTGLTLEPETGKYYSGDYYVMPGGWHKQTNYLTGDEGDYKYYQADDPEVIGGTATEGDIKTENSWQYVDRPYAIAPRFRETQFGQGGIPDIQNQFISTLAAFTPEQVSAQQLVEQRALGGSDYLPLSEPQSAMSRIITGGNQIGQNPALAPNIGTPAQLGSPYIQNIGDMTPSMVNQWGSPQAQGVGYTDLGYRNWDELQRLISGEFLAPESNPYLAGMVEYAQRPITENYINNILPYLDTTAIEAGRYGSDTWADLRGQESENYLRALSDISNQMYGGAYESERQRMVSGLGLSGELASTQAGIEAQRQAQIGTQAQQGAMLGAGQSQERAMQNALFGQEAGRLGYETDAERAMQEALLRQQTGEFNIGFDQQRALELADMMNTINMFNAQQRTGAEGQNIANIMQASVQAPELALADYEDYARLAGLGEDIQSYNQKMLEEDIARINWGAMLPWELAGMESQLIGGNWGSNIRQQATQQIEEAGGKG